MPRPSIPIEAITADRYARASHTDGPTTLGELWDRIEQRFHALEALLTRDDPRPAGRSVEHDPPRWPPATGHHNERTPHE